jgi:hypothetical protein
MECETTEFGSLSPPFRFLVIMGIAWIISILFNIFYSLITYTPPPVEEKKKKKKRHHVVFF